jgi:hypothetical protein
MAQLHVLNSIHESDPVFAGDAEDVLNHGKGVALCPWSICQFLRQGL